MVIAGGRWPLWLLLITLAALLAVVFSGTGLAAGLKSPGVQALSPVQHLVRGVTGGAGSFLDTVGRINALADENHQLRQQVQQLQREIIRLQEAGQENRQLRALLDYQRDHPGLEYLAASVIGYDPNGLVQSLTVDRGTKDGVQTGMVVVSAPGLLGKVVESYPRAARVLLITDPSNVINVLLQRSRVQGVVTGRADRNLDLQYVDKTADVVVGDLVLTSGLGGGYPEGIPLGRVSRIIDKDQALFKEIQVQPLASVASQRNVLVITDFTPVALP